MKTNIVIIGDNEKTNKAVGANLAVCLEINFLDFDGYCEYINCVNREDICRAQGKRRYNEMQKGALPHMQDFCDSVIGFDGKLSRMTSVYKMLKDTAYIICIADKGKEKYSEYADIWIDVGKKSEKRITNEILKKLGEL